MEIAATRIIKRTILAAGQLERLDIEDHLNRISETVPVTKHPLYNQIDIRRVELRGARHTIRDDSAPPSGVPNDANAVVSGIAVFAVQKRASNDITSTACCDSVTKNHKSPSLQTIQAGLERQYRGWITCDKSKPHWNFDLGFTSGSSEISLN